MPTPYENSYLGNGPTFDDSGSIVTPTLSAGQSTNKTKTYADFNGDWRGYLEYMANQGDPASLDKLINHLMDLESREYQANRDDNAYQRLVKDLRSAGINPAILMSQSASPISSPYNSHSGSQFLSQYSAKEGARHNKETESRDWLKALLSLIPIALMFALA